MAAQIGSSLATLLFFEIPGSRATFIRRRFCSARQSTPTVSVSCRATSCRPKHSSRIAASTQDALSELKQVKERLILQLEATDGYISDEAIQIVTELQKLNPTPDYTAFPELYIGAFEGIKVSFKGTGRKGEGAKEVAGGSAITLGKLSFNSFKPNDLEVFLGQVYNHVGLSEREYVLISEFQVSKVQDLELGRPLYGLSILKGDYATTSPVRMAVEFKTITLAPRYPDSDLALWKSVFEKENPGMDEKGVVPVQLPPIPGFLDYLYLDDELRVSRGSLGNINVVRRIQEPVIAL